MAFSPDGRQLTSASLDNCQGLGHPRRWTRQDPDGTGGGCGGPRRQARWKRGRRGRGK
ncbi:MAG: hypothetical protein ACXVCF_22545, partial [Isosphaeraceae bacterium]